MRKLGIFNMALAAFVVVSITQSAHAEEFYVAVATSVLDGTSASEPGFKWNHATGWSRDSGNGASLEAVKACSRSRGRQCFRAGGSSMRGGCVAMVEGLWLDHGNPKQKLEIFTWTNQVRHLAEEEAMDQCRIGIKSGKYEDAVQEWKCTPKVSYCSADVRP